MMQFEHISLYYPEGGGGHIATFTSPDEDFQLNQTFIYHDYF